MPTDIDPWVLFTLGVFVGLVGAWVALKAPEMVRGSDARH